MLKLVRCGKVGKTGERKNPKYGLYKGRKNQDFMVKYSPLHISSVTSSGETQAALLGNLTQENSTVTQQFHTTMNTPHSGQTEGLKAGEMVPPYKYNMLPILLSNSSSL